MYGTTTGVIKGNTRSLENGSCRDIPGILRRYIRIYRGYIGIMEKRRECAA